MRFVAIGVTLCIFFAAAEETDKSITKKLSGIDEPVTLIQEYPDNENYPLNFQSVHVINNKGEIFYIRGGDDRIFKQNDVPFPVTTMHTFTRNGGNRKVGDIYFGTINGVYLRKAGESTSNKISGIDDPISLIQEYPDNVKFPNNLCSVHVITNKGEIFYIRGGDDMVFKQNDVPSPITTMHTFTKATDNQIIGDIYFGTTKGVYLRKGGAKVATKIVGIDDPVANIQECSDPFCNVHVTTNTGEVYSISGPKYSVVKKTDVPFPVTTIYTFSKDGQNRKSGDIYFGTTNGVYLRRAVQSGDTKVDNKN